MLGGFTHVSLLRLGAAIGVNRKSFGELASGTESACLGDDFLNALV